MPNTARSADPPNGRRILIDSDQAVAGFRASLLSPAFPSHNTQIVLDPSRFGPDSAKVEERANELYRDCGCDAGGVVVLLALVSMIAWVVLTSPEISWSLGLAGFGFLLASALLGKALGLVRSRLLLWRLLSRRELTR